jgi:hypothetical protein
MLVASNLSVSAGATTSISTDVLPGSNGAYDIGASFNAWKNLYAGTATLSGSLSANVATLSSPVNMGANSVYTTGNLGSSSNRASTVYSANVDTGPLAVNSNASIAGSVTCYSINTQNSNISAGSGSISGGALSGTSATLSGSLSANGATLSAPVNMGANSVYTTGNVGSSSNRTSTMYSANVDTGALAVNSNASIAGSVTCYSINTQNSNISAGSGSISGGALSGTSAILSGSLSANGATLTPPLSMGSNAVYTTGTVSSSSNRASSVYSASVDAGSLTVNSNASIAGSVTCYSINTQNSNISAGSGSISGGALSGTSATLSGSLSANGATLSAPVNMGANSVYTTGNVGSSSNRTSTMYSANVDTGALAVNSNASIAGSMTCYSINSQNSNISAGSGSISGGALSGTSATLLGPLSANGATLSAPLSMGSNAVYTRGTVSSSSNRASAVYSASVDAGSLTVNSNASIAGALTCYSLNTQNSNINAGSGSISGGGISGTSASLLGQLTCKAIDTQGCNISAGGINGGAFDGSSMSVGTGSVSGGSGSFSGDVTVSGKLQVGGSIDYISTSELLVADKHVTLAATSNPTDATASGAGLYVQGSNYAASNATLSFTWNQGCNGNYWLPKGGNLALPGTAGSKMVTLSTTSNGALQLLSDDGTSSTSTALVGVSLIASGSNMDLGSTSNAWSTLYASNVGVSAKRVATIYASSIDAGAGAFGSNVGVTGSLVAANGLASSNGLTVSSGTLTLPASSVVNAAIASGLDATKITTGTFGVGAFGGCDISTTGTLGAGPSTLSTVSCTTLTTNNSNMTVGSGSITSGQHNPTTSATYDLGASATAWKSAYLSSNLTAGGAITGSNTLTLPGQNTCRIHCSLLSTKLPTESRISQRSQARRGLVRSPSISR